MADALTLAIEAQVAGRLKEAERLYRLIIKSNPRNTSALTNLAAVRIAQGDPKDGLKLAAASLAIFPNQPNALNNRAQALVALGRHEEAVAAYDRAIALKPDQAELHYNKGGVLHGLGRLEEALEAYEQAIAIGLGHYGAAMNRGNVLRDLERYDEALDSYDRAIALDAGGPTGFVNRGNVLGDLGRLDEALAAYDQAIVQDPGASAAFLYRGNTLRDLGRFDDAFASYDQAMALAPKDPEGPNSYGFALQKLNRLDEALAYYERSIALSPGFATALWNKGAVLLLQGDYPAGWAHYEWRWKRRDLGAGPRFVAPPWLGGAPVAGKSILLHAEQGLGDTLQMIRYAPVLAAQGARVTVAVQTPLKALVQAIPGLEAVLRLDDIEGREAAADYDLHTPMMSLPLAMGSTVDTVPNAVPYLAAPQAARAAWSQRLGPRKRPRIGLVWSGNRQHKNDRNRSLPLTALAPLLDLDADIVSLQTEYRDADLAALKADGRIMDFSAELKDFSDTAALIEQLDLVVSVDTSVAHLAGALGRPVFILLPFAPDFRWGIDRSDSPWYPTATLFRQAGPGDWGSAITDAAAKAAKVLAP